MYACMHLEGELKNRSGVKEEGFKEKNEVTDWLIKAESWTIDLSQKEKVYCLRLPTGLLRLNV